MSLTAISEGFTSSAAGAQQSWDSVGDSLSGIPFVGDDLQRTFESLAAATFGNAAETGQSVTDAVTLAANVLAFVTFAAPAAVVLVLWLPRRLDRARAWDAADRVLSAVPMPPAFLGPGAVGPVDALADDRSHDTVALPWGPGSAVAGPAAAPAGPAAPTGPAAPAGPVATPAALGGATHGGAAHPAGGIAAFPPDELLALRALCHLPFEDLARFTPRPFEAFASGDYAPLVAALYAHEGLVPPGWATSR
jgi:hypothetical protein